MKKKFPNATIGQIDFKLASTDIIAYAYLSKNIKFKIKFDLRAEKEFLFNGNPVRSFWARTEAQKKQIMCYHYVDQADFIVSIADADGKDLIFLIKSPKPLTVDEAIAAAIRLERKPSSPLNKHDFF